MNSFQLLDVKCVGSIVIFVIEQKRWNQGRPLQGQALADAGKVASRDTSLLWREAENEEPIVPELVLLGLEMVCELCKIGQVHIAASAMY